jgi:hypothetical protein
MWMKKGCIAGLFVALLVLGSASAFGYHDTLYVVVNGVRLNPAQIQVLEQLSCGPIPSGRYWLNVNTGVWGYERGPAQGRIGDRCAGSGGGSPADKWVGPNDRFQTTPFGNWGGSGDTFYYYDPDTGTSVMPGN